MKEANPTLGVFYYPTLSKFEISKVGFTQSYVYQRFQELSTDLFTCYQTTLFLKNANKKVFK